MCVCANELESGSERKSERGLEQRERVREREPIKEKKQSIDRMIMTKHLSIRISYRLTPTQNEKNQTFNLLSLVGVGWFDN